MIHINRHLIPEPDVLKKYRQGKHQWDNVSRADKKVLREALKSLQHCCCAYCGDKLTTDNKMHIDHFETRSRYPQKTFCWSNLFLCCSNDGKAYCASYKDASNNKNKNKKILKPDEINPKCYFTYDRGEMKCKKSCPDLILAQNTIDRLNLNHRTLVEKRKNVLKCVDSTIADLESGELYGKTDLKDLLRDLQEHFGFDLMLEEYFESKRKKDGKNAS